MKHVNSDRLEYSQITKYIYIGTNMCCQMHFDRTLMKKEGITVDISLEQERIDTPFGVTFYVWMPVRDHFPPTPEQLAFGVAAIEKCMSMRKKMYIHCRNGHGRAPTLVAAYLISTGMSVKDVLVLLKKQRPSVHINKRQQVALVRFAKRFRK